MALWSYRDLKKQIANDTEDPSTLRTFDANIVHKKSGYKFRAETIVDVAKLLQVKEFIQLLESITINTDEDGLPDVDVDLQTVDWCNLGLLRKVIKESNAPDIHVILDTVNYAEVYTGERRQ